MDLSGLKNAAPNRQLFKRGAALLFSLIIIVVSYLAITKASKDANDVVAVLRVKPSEGIPAFAQLNDNLIEKYNIIRKEYTDDMVLAEDLDEVKDKLTANFLRKNTVLYKDQLIDEKPQKNEWLYQVHDDNEVLTLPYNFLEVGGDILMPGDRVRIRVTYDVDSAGGSGGNPNAVYSQSPNKVKKTEVLFDSIVVKDMLNANSHSIYEVYKEVQKLDENKKQEVMKSKEFLKNIQPRALLLEGTTEQINKFAKYKGLDGNSFLITILSRKDSDVIVDQLPTLEKEVESWIGSDE
ncbi:flagellar biosynthesis protein FlgA [Paenibacillus sp. 7124]|uniref:Flagellar biosynthesis protein FlgA n=1 Tax=Paenibacillus apii TaxID=1850370 RepID=A0A6M1PI11_9BACL|nr:flagellar biosynthesis protein FlgA [Paenibacillus apii]NGM82816.1 flagellar biosynthesis protein FlgA [Paenibacillus apii]NJJ39956.1 flagellar biosynthesis protein FlgA [Paenibacillus apii]